VWAAKIRLHPELLCLLLGMSHPSTHHLAAATLEPQLILLTRGILLSLLLSMNPDRCNNLRAFRPSPLLLLHSQRENAD